MLTQRVSVIALTSALNDVDASQAFDEMTLYSEIRSAVRKGGPVTSARVLDMAEDLFSLSSIVQELEQLQPNIDSGVTKDHLGSALEFATPVQNLIKIADADNALITALVQDHMPLPISKTFEYTDNPSAGKSRQRKFIDKQRSSEASLATFWDEAEEMLDDQGALSDDVKLILESAVPKQTAPWTARAPTRTASIGSPGRTGSFANDGADTGPRRITQEARKDKEKTRGKVNHRFRAIQAAAAPAQQQAVPPPRIGLRPAHYATLSLLMGPRAVAARPGEVSWNAIVQMMDGIGFDCLNAGGSACTFRPRPDLQQTQVSALRRFKIVHCIKYRKLLTQMQNIQTPCSQHSPHPRPGLPFNVAANWINHPGRGRGLAQYGWRFGKFYERA